MQALRLGLIAGVAGTAVMTAGQMAYYKATGIVFGLVVWGASLVHLPAMKLAPPVWEMAPSSIAPDVGFHLLYGVAVAETHRALS